MTFKRHKYPPLVRSLLHFNYDYPDSVAAATTTSGAGGLRDEIGLDTWAIQGYVTFVGQEQPVNVVSDTPKFGWRCPQFGGTIDYVKNSNTSGMWNLKPSGKYEIDFFLRPTDSAAGNIFVLRSGTADLLTLTKDATNKLILKSEIWGNIYVTSATALTTNKWHYLTLRIGGKKITVYVDQAQMITADITTDTRLSVAEVRLGGFPGQVDEFKFMHTVTTGVPLTPTVPFAGSFDLGTISGYGNGSFGDETLTVAGNVQINTYAPVTAMYADAATIGTISNGKYGTFVPGNEVMVHLSLKRGSDESELGFYAIRRIARITGNDVVFDRPIVDEFDASTAASKYVVQLILIPNYKTLVLQLGVMIVPKLWDGACGGIVALKTQGNCHIFGKIITEAAGPMRTDGHNLTHTDIVERFINTGNIFMACGGTLKAPVDARIGAPQAGDLKGTVGLGRDGEGGNNANNPAGGKGGDPGFGGRGGKKTASGYIAGGGGGGARGKGGDGSGYTAQGGEDGGDGKSAPNVIVIAKKLAVETAVISTGGAAGGNGSLTAAFSPGYGAGPGGSNGGVAIPIPGKHMENSTVYTDGKIGTVDGRAGIGINATGTVGEMGAGAGYGAPGGKGKSAYVYGDGSGAGGGAGTGFAYLSFEEMGYDG